MPNFDTLTRTRKTAAPRTAQPTTIAAMAQTAKANVAQGISKPMLSLVSDVRNFQGVEGLFAPFPGPDSLTFGGSLLGLANSHGVKVPDLKDVPEDGVTEAADEAGHTWYLRCCGGWMITAFRERTEAELVELAEQHADSLVRMVPTYRVQCIRRTAIELMRMAEAMSPDRCPSRSARRLMKKRINAVGQLQFDMLCGTSVSMAEIRERMEALAVEFPYSFGTTGKAVQA